MTPLAPKDAAWRDRWIDWVLRHARLVLLLGAALTVVAGALASRLEVDSDLRRLLPQDHPVVASLERFEEIFGSTGSVNVVVAGGTKAERHALADTLAAELAADPMIEAVEYRLPSDFFVEHALYYLDEARMKELERRVSAWSHYEVCTAAPDVCVDAPDPKAPQALETFIQAEQDRSRMRTGFADYYERDGIDALVLLLRPVRPSSDLVFAQEVVSRMRARVREIFERTGAGWDPSAMRMNVVGPYVVKADGHATIRRDMVRSGAVALAGVLLILYLLFRSLRAVLILLVPLICGVVWALGATELVLGHLNSMTSLISTVVMGMGIDAGIHFFSRARRNRAHHDDAEAIRLAFHGLIVPLLVASSTTMGAFAVMATSGFPVFREFGIIAAMGVALSLLAMVTVLPALASVVGIKPRRAGASDGGAGRLAHGVLARPGLVFAGLVVVTLASFQGVRRASFEYDGRKLQSDLARARTEADTHLISRIFGKDIHAGVLVLPDLDAARLALARARRRHEVNVERGTSVVAELFAAPDLLPPADVDMVARWRRIQQMAEDIPDTAWRRIDELAGFAPRVEDEWGEPTSAAGEGDAALVEPAGGEAAVGRSEAPSARLAGDEGLAEQGHGPAGEGDGAVAAVEAAPASSGVGSSGELDEGGWGPVIPAEGGGAAGDDGARVAAGEGDAPAQAGEGVGAAESGREAGALHLSADQARMLRRMFRARPFRPEDLPPVVWRKVAAPDGHQGVFAYPAFDAANIAKGVEFMDETAGYVEDPKTQRFVGETTVYAAMYLMLRQEAPLVLGMAAVLIAALVFWQLRALSWTVLTLLPLALALWWLVGLMGFIGLEFTLFNLPILPAILGIGVDNGVYLTDRIRRSRGEEEGLARSLHETGGAILAATTTTAVGFAAFMVADSGGLRGIGALAVLGILLAAAAAIFVLPTLVALSRARRG